MSKGNIEETRRRLALVLAVIVTALMLSSGVALAATITCQSGVDCFGTTNADTLEGAAMGDHIYGRGANDILRGRGGFDKLYGQGGSDKLLGGLAKDDLYGGSDNDELRGGADYDRYLFLTNNWGKDSIADSTTLGSSLHFGQPGGLEWVTDDLTIRITPSASPEVKNASGTSTINWESTTLIDDVYGGYGDDTITGNLLDNSIDGWGGTDTIFSGPGNDDINVVDGEEDRVDCGSNLFGQDHDYVIYDSLDEVVDNCEEKVPST